MLPRNRLSVLGEVTLKLVEMASDMLCLILDLLNKLGGEEGGAWLSAFKCFLRKENPWLNPHLEWWMRFYRDEGIVVDPDSLTIPPKPEGKWWLIVVAPGLTYNQVVAMLRKKFEVWLWTKDLDKVINLSKEQRRAIDKPYAIWVKANVEADSELRGKSANDLAGQDVVTLMERLLLEVFYFCLIAEGKHLDINNVTLCAGSRCVVGSVPHVNLYSDDGRVGVLDYNPDRSFDNLRARQAVS